MILYLIEILLPLRHQTICDMKYDEFHDLVKANGWERLRQSGSHVIYRKGSRTYPVPYHKGKELGKGRGLKTR